MKLKCSLKTQRALARAVRLRLPSPGCAARARAGAPRGGHWPCVADCRQARARVGRRRDARAPPEPVTLLSLILRVAAVLTHPPTRLTHMSVVTWSTSHMGQLKPNAKNAQCPSEHIMPRHSRLSRLSRSTESSPWRPCSRPARPSAGTAGGSPRRPRTSPRPPPPS